MQNDSVTDYIQKNQTWEQELILLRELILLPQLTETIKWGSPVYTFNHKNIVGISAFKSYVGLWFFNGATLLDKNHVLINAQEGVTKAMRQWRFSNIEEIENSIDTIQQYLLEAVENQKKGNIFTFNKVKPLLEQDAFIAYLKEDILTFEKYNLLGLTKKREFVEYYNEAKREVTKSKRLQQIKNLIQNDIGLNDKYK